MVYWEMDCRINSPADLERFIKNALVWYGSCAENWRIKILDRYEVRRGSDWAYIEVDVYKYRCRKPIQGWKLCMDSIHKTIWFDRSTFWYY